MGLYKGFGPGQLNSTQVQRITEKTEMEEGFFQEQSLNWYTESVNKEMKAF